MKRTWRIAFLSTFILGSTLLVPTLEAQVRYGSIVVEVTDQTGGAIPGAEVAITQAETGLTRNTVSNDIGIANFASIPPGTYSVRVNISGFKEFVTTGVAVSEDSTVRVGSVLD